MKSSLVTQGVKELALSLIQLWLQLRLRFDFWAENFLMSQVQPKKEREREREREREGGRKLDFFSPSTASIQATSHAYPRFTDGEARSQSGRMLDLCSAAEVPKVIDGVKLLTVSVLGL